MRLDELDYDLPPELIAQEPAPTRDGGRMLVVDSDAFIDSTVRALPTWLDASDVLVLNNTRVLPAKVTFHRATGGAVDALFLERDADAGEDAWRVLLRGSKRLKTGDRLRFDDQDTVVLVASHGGGEWTVTPATTSLTEFMRMNGSMPLPPYIRRVANDARAPMDKSRYQTTFAEAEGAIAAPTAGLHFTQELFAALQAKGIEIQFVTLHVGRGTFAAVRTDDLDDHDMHTERYSISDACATALERARKEKRRIVAVGTTTVRALEAATKSDGTIDRGEQSTNLLIQPGYRFNIVDALFTNFHLPRSTLLALVSAFAGHETIMRAYKHAVSERYRFYSYGDAMLLSSRAREDA